jgi:hypothetical protein
MYTIHFLTGAGVFGLGVATYFTYRDVVWDMAVKALVKKTR